MSNVIFYKDILWSLGVKSVTNNTSQREEEMLIQLIRWDNEVLNKCDSEHNKVN